MIKTTLILAFKIIALLLGVGLTAAAVVGCCVLQEMGALPDAADEQEFKKLAYYKNGHFVAPPAAKTHPQRTVKAMPSGWGRMILPSPNRPRSAIPQVALTTSSFAEASNELAAYWLGHSTLIIEIEGKRLLVDPIFGNAAPLPLAAMRYVDSPLPRDQLPPIDYVLITHDHYDHLEYATMRALRNQNTRFIVPYGVSAHLTKWGIPRERISQIGWGEAYTENDLTIAAEPTVHWSGRTTDRSQRSKTLWASYSLKGKTHRVFISGDSGYGEHFREIGLKHGPFDLAFIEIDGWNPNWPNNHMFPEEVIKTYHDVRATALVPVHWGVFDMAWHPWNESITILSELAKADGQVKMLTPLMGEKLTPESQTQEWWVSGIR